MIYYNVEATTGIKQFTANYTISDIAPNPATDDIAINYNLKNTMQPASLKMYNMLGTLVKTVALESYSQQTKIDVTSLETGIYFYSVIMGGKALKTSRLIISR